MPDEKAKKKFICIYRTPEQGEMVVIKSLLDVSEIPYFIENESFAVSFGPIDGAVNFGIMVAEECVEEARELLRDFITPKPRKEDISLQKPFITKKHKGSKNVSKAILVVILLGIAVWVLREFSYEMVIPQESRKKIRECKARFKSNAKDAESSESLGYIYFTLRRYNKAAYYYKRAIEIEPDIYSQYGGLGATYLARGDFGKAIPILQKAITLNPKDELSYINLGKAYNGMGKYDSALSYFQKALELNPSDSSAYGGLSFAYYYLGKYNKMLESAKKQIEMAPSECYGYYNAGLALAEKGFLKEAISFFEETINIQPRYAKAHYNLGLVYKKNGNMELVQQQYKKLKELHRYDLANRLIGDEKSDLHFDLANF